MDPVKKDQTWINQKPYSLRQDRTLRLLLISALLILIMGSLRPDKPTGLYPDQYWALKTMWRHCANMVVAGDSRVAQGVSPSEMNKILPRYEILNYGFYGVCYSQDYLQAIERVLNTESPQKTIILGISPHTVTGSPDKKDGFRQAFEQNGADKFLDIHLAGLVFFFKPMSFRDALFGLFPRLKKSHTFTEFFADGWIACRLEPETKKYELRRYQKIFQEEKLSPKIQEYLFHFVSRWTAAGIRVYGFRPPSCVEMLKLENELSGFKEDIFIQAFESAGGIWLDFDQLAYHTSDGSHLRRDAAQQLSVDLAQKILHAENILNQGKNISHVQ